MNKTDSLKNLLKNRTLMPRMWIYILNHLPIRFVYKKDRELLNQHRAYKKIEKFCQHNYSSVKANFVLHEKNETRDIWVLWLQGWDNVPEIVGKCRESLVNVANDFTIHYIDHNWIKNNLNIPQQIEKKFEKGIIGNAHYSDIVRLFILYKYGGIWIDATVYFTDDRLLNLIKDESLFFFRACNNYYVKISNWLISAEKNNYIIYCALCFLVRYWERYNVPAHYFIMHMMVTWLLNNHPDIEEKMLYIPNASPLFLGGALNDTYNGKVFNGIVEQTSVHKLSYKNIIDKDNSYYNYIITKEFL